MILPEGADRISRGLSVIRGQASFGKAPGPSIALLVVGADRDDEVARSKSSVQRCQVSIF
jgi:hypothetical protein